MTFLLLSCAHTFGLFFSFFSQLPNLRTEITTILGKKKSSPEKKVVDIARVLAVAKKKHAALALKKSKKRPASKKALTKTPKKKKKTDKAKANKKTKVDKKQKDLAPAVSRPQTPAAAAANFAVSATAAPISNVPLRVNTGPIQHTSFAAGSRNTFTQPQYRATPAASPSVLLRGPETPLAPIIVVVEKTQKM